MTTETTLCPECGLDTATQNHAIWHASRLQNGGARQPAGAPCSKCGGTSTSCRWHETAAHCLYGSRAAYAVNEHLHYTCQTCGYWWTGPVKEKAEPPLT